MEKILISPCLLGDNVKWNGGNNYWPFVEKLKKHYELVPFCSEVAGGLTTPRLPSEIRNSSVINKEGKDVTSHYTDAAKQAVQICKLLGIRIAILKDGSPACGSRQIYNGKFEGIKIEGLGITARALINAGIKVYAESDNLEFLLPNLGKEKAILKKNLEKQKEKEEEKAKKTRKRTSAPEGEEKSERKPRGRKPYGEKKSYGKKPSYRKDGEDRGEKKSYSKGPRDSKSFDKKPRRSFGNKKDGEKKSYGSKRSYGDKKKSFGDKKSYGAKKSFGPKKSYGNKPAGRRPSKKGE
ncbi:MAG: DUF523 domain-containing protein [Bacilli bacterium]|nr:DUF523 domain-containing protein [Bacilli bacterium]